MASVRFGTEIRTITDCSPDQLEAFCNLVNAGQEVAQLTAGWLRDHGVKLVFVSTEDRLVAVGALKKPHPNYHASCFLKAGVSELLPAYRIELGWIYCEPKFRGGMSYRVLDPLLDASNDPTGIYATVRTDNLPMTQSLRRRGFRVVGRTYKSVEHPTASVQLLVREPM